MSMKIDPIKPPSGTPPVEPPAAPGGDGGFNKVFQEVAMNIFNGGQGMMKEAMEKMFPKDEEPDEDDPDSEPL